MTDKKKTGPRPKELIEGTIVGLEVGRGENKNVVPPDQVQELAALGCLDKEISNFFGIKDDSLRRNFAEQLIKGREQMKVKLRKAMFKNACVNMNAAVQIFLAKNILGMADIPVNNEQNQPLPWVESEEDLEIKEDIEDIEDAEEK